jgi:hypothetical protein
VELADLLQVDGAAATGTTYATVAQLNTKLDKAGGTVTGDLAVQGVLRVPDSATIEVGADTNLYRAGANKLGTDDALDVGGDLRTFGTFVASGSVRSAGFLFGATGNTNRSAR